MPWPVAPLCDLRSVRLRGHVLDPKRRRRDGVGWFDPRCPQCCVISSSMSTWWTRRDFLDSLLPAALSGRAHTYWSGNGVGTAQTGHRDLHPCGACELNNCNAITWESRKLLRYNTTHGLCSTHTVDPLHRSPDRRTLSPMDTASRTNMSVGVPRLMTWSFVMSVGDVHRCPSVSIGAGKLLTDGHRGTHRRTLHFPS